MFMNAWKPANDDWPIDTPSPPESRWAGRRGGGAAEAGSLIDECGHCSASGATA